jgi:hypothetical protein
MHDLVDGGWLRCRINSMRTLLLISALLFSVNVWAEWTLLDISPDENDRYIETDLIKVSSAGSKTVHFWELVNYKNPQDGIKSKTSYMELYCSTLSLVTDQTHYFSEPFGDPKSLIESIRPIGFRNPTPNSYESKLAQKICKDHKNW